MREIRKGNTKKERNKVQEATTYAMSENTSIRHDIWTSFDPRNMDNAKINAMKLKMC